MARAVTTGWRKNDRVNAPVAPEGNEFVLSD
jgi:hypothetical protein